MRIKPKVPEILKKSKLRILVACQKILAKTSGEVTTTSRFGGSLTNIEANTRTQLLPLIIIVHIKIMPFQYFSFAR